MKKAIAIMVVAVLAVSLVFAAGVAATPGPGPNKVDAKGAVTHMHFATVVPGGINEDVTGKWHVKLDLVKGKVDAKFDAKTSAGKVKIKSVTGTGATWSYATGVLTVSGLTFTVTTDGTQPGPGDTTQGADICGQIQVDTDSGTMELNTRRCPDVGPSGTVNLDGNVKDIKLKY